MLWDMSFVFDWKKIEITCVVCVLVLISNRFIFPVIKKNLNSSWFSDCFNSIFRLPFMFFNNELKQIIHQKPAVMPVFVHGEERVFAQYTVQYKGSNSILVCFTEMTTIFTKMNESRDNSPLQFQVKETNKLKKKKTTPVNTAVLAFKLFVSLLSRPITIWNKSREYRESPLGYMWLLKR